MIAWYPIVSATVSIPPLSIQHTSFSREDLASYAAPATPTTPDFNTSLAKTPMHHRILDISRDSFRPSDGSPPVSTPYLKVR